MCIFCKIIAGEIPADKVYEDESVLAFLDISPINPGHTLVVPKKHYANLEEIPEKELFAIMAVVKIIGKSVKDSALAAGYNVGINNDPVAGQVVPHLHVHVIPRREHDGHALWRGGKYEAGEAEKILGQLRITN